MTTLTQATAQPLPLADVPARVDAALHAFLDDKMRTARQQRMPVDVPQAIRRFLDGGGKRLRPTLCVLGYQAAGGHGDEDAMVRVAAGLEMFHAFALIHDDIMDNNATRRGQPTVHHALTRTYDDAQLGPVFGRDQRVVRVRSLIQIMEARRCRPAR
ncbi:polyprenyl synthetase family protein [Streptomyces sp. NRRL B-1347]|uniref:polyprenyl synthetase family protein n=1 Tax=Streptomyces sp. NRRL B-1347 TaxID=1476877 RepID=UPI0004CB2D55|nr:polyprenyl synthetase family protein [Streptomyces sp. NRRL B-1347]